MPVVVADFLFEIPQWKSFIRNSKSEIELRPQVRNLSANQISTRSREGKRRHEGTVLSSSCLRRPPCLCVEDGDENKPAKGDEFLSAGRRFRISLDCRFPVGDSLHSKFEIGNLLAVARPQPSEWRVARREPIDEARPSGVRTDRAVGPEGRPIAPAPVRRGLR